MISAPSGAVALDDARLRTDTLKPHRSRERTISAPVRPEPPTTATFSIGDDIVILLDEQKQNEMGIEVFVYRLDL